MKKLAIILTMLCATPAYADDVTIKINFPWKPTLDNAQVALDRCIGGIMSRGDSSVCREVQGFLAQLASLPTTPVPNPEAKASPDGK